MQQGRHSRLALPNITFLPHQDRCNGQNKSCGEWYIFQQRMFYRNLMACIMHEVKSWKTYPSNSGSKLRKQANFSWVFNEHKHIESEETSLWCKKFLRLATTFIKSTVMLPINRKMSTVLLPASKCKWIVLIRNNILLFGKLWLRATRFEIGKVEILKTVSKNALNVEQG